MRLAEVRQQLVGKLPVGVAPSVLPYPVVQQSAVGGRVKLVAVGVEALRVGAGVHVELGAGERLEMFKLVVAKSPVSAVGRLVRVQDPRQAVRQPVFDGPGTWRAAREMLWLSDKSRISSASSSKPS